MPEVKTKIHPCSLEHYNRYRLRGPSGAIVAVGSQADMSRMSGLGTVEFFAKATK